jgi:hypothetical protein
VRTENRASRELISTEAAIVQGAACVSKRVGHRRLRNSESASFLELFDTLNQPLKKNLTVRGLVWIF